MSVCYHTCFNTILPLTHSIDFRHSTFTLNAPSQHTLQRNYYSGAKDWLKIFAMQRRIRRRLRSGSSSELDLLATVASSNSNNSRRIESSRSSHSIPQQQQQQVTRTQQRRLSGSQVNLQPHRNLINGNIIPSHHISSLVCFLTLVVACFSTMFFLDNRQW